MEGLDIVVSSSTVETPRASATLDNTTSSSPSHSSIAATPGLSSPKPNAFQALMKGRAGKLKPSSQPEKKKQRTGKLIAAGKSVMEGARKAPVGTREMVLFVASRLYKASRAGSCITLLLCCVILYYIATALMLLILLYCTAIIL